VDLLIRLQKMFRVLSNITGLITIKFSPTQFDEQGV
jgi:hypothetical protein